MLIPYVDEITVTGDHRCGLGCKADQIFVFCTRQTVKQNKIELATFRQCISYLRVALQNILTEFCVPLKVVTAIEMCLKEACDTVQADISMRQALFRKLCNKGMFCRNCFTTPLQNTPLGRSKKFRRDWN
jgi:hypothetical protein